MGYSVEVQHTRRGREQTSQSKLHAKTKKTLEVSLVRKGARKGATSWHLRTKTETCAGLKLRPPPLQPLTNQPQMTGHSLARILLANLNKHYFPTLYVGSSSSLLYELSLPFSSSSHDSQSLSSESLCLRSFRTTGRAKLIFRFFRTFAGACFFA